MAEIETIGILDEIQSIVSDKLQVVSYKWLSRNFSMSSDSAKSLLEQFVVKYGDGLEVIYCVSGWLKDNPSTYHIRLVPKQKLSDVKQQFDGNCSIQVYSVQACLPKDPATLWNHEYVQAEDLFKQPLTVDNCLRNNMFSGVSNSFVTRNVGGTHTGTDALLVKNTGVSESSKSNSARQTTTVSQAQQKKVQLSSPREQSLDTAKNVKTVSHVKIEREQGARLVPDKEKAPQLIPDKRKGQSDKTSSGAGNALTSMWGRASAKPKPDIPLEQANNSIEKSAANEEAPFCGREVVEYGSSDEDGKDFKIKRGEGSRKRRVVFDYSDEEDEYKDAVNLASPDPPKRSTRDSINRSLASGLESNLRFEEEKETRPSIKEVKEADVKANKNITEKLSDMSKDKKDESPIPENTSSHSDVGKTDRVADARPEKRKVLKTRIDERGREVTEVVMEDKEADTKSDNNSTKMAENNRANNAIDRPHVVKKSPAVGNSVPTNQTGKAGNKKGGSKDPKQGNILSFFKKV